MRMGMVPGSTGGQMAVMDPKQRQEMMEKCMDMMQTMMEQVMHHDQMMHDMPVK